MPATRLGYIFFRSPNRYGIYMHDTANRWLFTEGSRNFSHGCIRLQNPLDFAEKAFNGKNALTRSACARSSPLASRPITASPNRFTLYVTYRTVTADAVGVPTSATTSTAATPPRRAGDAKP